MFMKLYEDEIQGDIDNLKSKIESHINQLILDIWDCSEWKSATFDIDNKKGLVEIEYHGQYGKEFLKFSDHKRDNELDNHLKDLSNCLELTKGLYDGIYESFKR